MTGTWDDEPPTHVKSAVLRQTRVMVVDDDDDLRALVACALRDDGHAVLESRDALEALTRLSSMMLAGLGEPDVVVSDVRMPRGGGSALIAGMRMRGCKTPVVLMTAYRASLPARSLWLDVTQVIDKPFDMNELRTAVRRLSLEGPAA
jgi:DNA-binding NtrC family response regulator